eukprot:5157166-Pyramimonas_sp.AAC.1
MIAHQRGTNHAYDDPGALVSLLQTGLRTARSEAERDKFRRAIRAFLGASKHLVVDRVCNEWPGPTPQRRRRLRRRRRRRSRHHGRMGGSQANFFVSMNPAHHEQPLSIDTRSTLTGGPCRPWTAELKPNSFK